MYKAKVFNGVKAPAGKPITGKGFFSDDHDLIDTPEYRESLKNTLIELGYTSFNNPLPASNKPYRRRGTPRKAMENTLQQYFIDKDSVSNLPSKVEDVFTGCVNSCPDKLSPFFCFNLMKRLSVITAAAVEDETGFSKSWCNDITQALQLAITMIEHCHDKGEIQVMFNSDYENDRFDSDRELEDILDLHIQKAA